MNPIRVVTLLLALGSLVVGAACDGPPPSTPPEPGECDATRACPAGQTCTGGSCEVICPPGTLSCPCNDDSTCSESGLECGAEGTCQEAGCEAGTVGCGCLADLSCATDDAGPPLRCDPDFRVCREVVDDSNQPGAPLATCFTPCTQSLTLQDGTVRSCRADGLMEGCIAGLACNQGTCVGNGVTRQACNRPTDCPEFQVCMDGGCYSNCETDLDCAGNGVCDLHVCRQTCDATATACERGFSCVTIDGNDGVCKPLSPPEPTPSVPVAEGFLLSVDDDTGGELPPSASGHVSVRFDAHFVKRTFRLTNAARVPLPFTVTKTEETRLSADGRETVTINPLFWVHMGPAGAATQQQTFTVTLQPGETRSFEISEPVNGDLRYWEGRLLVEAPGLGSQGIWLEFSSAPDGQWSGQVHYFTNFDDKQIDRWRADKSAGNAALTRNALLVQWTNFRENPLFSLRQFKTLLKSTRQGAWAEQQTQQACDDSFPNVTTTQHCYLYADGTPGEKGVVVYTDDAAEKRIPTNSMEMPFVMNLREQPNAPGTFVGRIESTRALQVPGNPAVELAFGGPTDACEDDAAAACIVPIRTFSTTVVLGGRHLVEAGNGCAAPSLKKAQTPWLLSDFQQGTAVDPDDGRLYREECKEGGFPLPSNVANALAINQSFTDSNPIPDGRVRRRVLTLLDGIMINQTDMLLLVAETFDANLGNGASTANFTTYGIIELSKNELEPEPADFVAGTQPATPTQPSRGLLATSCSVALTDRALGDGVALTASNAGRAARTLLTGIDAVAPPPPLTEAEVNNRIHWLCHSTGRFDGGPPTFGIAEPCPSSSLVTFFTSPGLASAIQNDSCQGFEADRCPDGDCSVSGRAGRCAEKLQALSASTVDVSVRVSLNPANACDSPGRPGTPDPDRVSCSQNRSDLREGRLFYPTGSSVKFSKLRSAVDDAFRYKSRFRARSGQGIGFVPSICALNSDIAPYCYDPAAIEELRERVDCLVSIFNEFPAQNSPGVGGMSAATRTELRETLGEVFSFYGEGPGGVPLPVGVTPFDGFERLYSELMIMKGDDSLTKAASSRFDLAGANNALFEGDLLEPGGIVISGGAGFEMNLLYQSGQYYQLVLDRFARLSPTLWKGLDDPANNFITIDTISTYFSRVIQASTKKARIASELATRYRAFNRPDLARRVIERAYAQAYLESTAIGQFMRRSVAVLDANELEALNIELERANRQTTIALDQMVEDYRGITDNVTFFGDPPEFISFPQAGSFDLSAVQIMVDRAKGTVALAKEREERALSVSRSFDTDAAQFQSELSRVANGFENELGELCGLFEGNDGNVYPAIPKFASLSIQTELFGNACGLVGNGTIFDTVGDLEQAATDLRIAVQAVRDTVAEAGIEETRSRQECGANFSLAALKFTQAGEIVTIQSQVADLNQSIGKWEKELAVLDRQSKVAASVAAVAQSVAGAAGCTGFGVVPCVIANAAAGVAFGAVTAFDAIALDKQNSANTDITGLQDRIQQKEQDIGNLQADQDFAQQVGQCCLDPNPNQQPVTNCQNPGPLVINSEARVKTIMLGMKRAELAADRADLEVQLVRGRLSQLRAKSTRLIAQQNDSEQLLINVEAARNDPNVRILKNADVLDADRSFKLALVDAFRATRVLEYYSGQTYADKRILFEARLVGRGESSVENYVNDLERDLRDFEERFGRPSARLAIVSLKNDIFNVPRVGTGGGALNDAERDTEFRRRLTDVALLDDRGYITVPFATTLDVTSPLTAIHKLTGIEIDLQGTGLGDSLARMYLTARGTGTVRSLEDDLIFHRFPAVTAVVNPTFGGQKRDDPLLYRNTRLQDRPFINSTWELGLNQRDEFVNKDINLSGLQDIKVYFYYEDFTFVE